MTKTEKVLLQLIAKGINSDFELNLTDFKQVNWGELIDVASKQGVLAIALDAVECLPAECRPDGGTLMEWIGQVLCIETYYYEHKKVIGHLANFYKQDNIRLMILKGYGLSLNYPKPEHRPVGDIDTYNFGLQRIADQKVHERKGIDIDNSHHRHSVFSFEGITVENHYDFIDDYAHASNKRFESELKKRVDKDCIEVEIGGNIIFLPSVNFNVLYILKHCAGHFAATHMSLRQLLDWLLFIKTHTNEIDWVPFYNFIAQDNLDRFANILNAIGVNYLGFNPKLFPKYENNMVLIERTINEIMSPEFCERENGSLLSGISVKIRRWWHNRWKHDMCYSESQFKDFVLHIYSKLLKPSHFRH